MPPVNPAFGQGFGAGESPHPLVGYALVWRDEFDGFVIDPKKWAPWRLGKRREAMNVASAARLDGNGFCHLTTRWARLSNGKREVQSGGIWTEGTYMPRYGYFEARIKFHSQPGHWAAFWLNCLDMGQPPFDPKGGVEMDIVEFHHKLGGGNEVVQTVHWNGYGELLKSKGKTVPLAKPHEDFHVYGLLWEPEGYRFYVDGRETFRVGKEDGAVISSRPQHIILSMEVGPWAGSISDAILPDGMTVDWVRHWQRR